MQVLKLTVLFSSWFLFSCAQKPSVKASIKWFTLPEATAALQQHPKPVLIDLYTGWCGWCKVMDKRTYQNKNVAEYIQQKFYPIKLDAETREQLTWNGKNYSFNKNYKTNELALYLTRGQLSYPTTVIIPPGGEPQAIPGFLTPAEFELIARYFGEGNDSKVAFEDFRKSFKSTW